MPWYHEIGNKVSHLFRRNQFDESLQEELHLHLEARTEELVANGIQPDEARAQARRELGSTGRIGEESREAWRFGWLEDFVRDLQYGLRALRRDRGFAITAVVSLALGIGVNTTIFSLAAEFLFSEPSVRDPSTLLRVDIGGHSHSPMREYRFIRDAKVFDGLAGANEMQEINWRDGETSQRLFVTRVTENFFEVMGVPLARGRPIQVGERDVAVISDKFFRSRMHGDPDVLGRLLVLDGQPHTIVGVLPSVHRTLTGFGYLPDLYVPVASEATSVGFYGRVPADITRAAAMDRLRSACVELDKVYPDGNHKWADDIAVTPLVGVARLNENIVRTISTLFGMLMVAVCLLLLIACANVASLLLARASTRMQEFAIRMSIGAGRGRVIRQLLTESLLLSTFGGGAGLLLNYLLTRFLNRAVIAAPYPITLAIEPDWRLLTYAALIAVLCALVAGVLPAVKSAGSNTAGFLKRDEHQVSGYRATLRNVLVAGQLAVSVVVLIVAVLSVRNLMRSAALDPGFDIHRTVWAQMRLVAANYSDVRKVRATVSATLDRVRAIPGVTSAAVAQVVPLNDHFLSRSTAVYSDVSPQGVRIDHAWNAVGPDYFRTMGIEILAGREFLESDREQAQRVVILNQAFASKLFGGTNPVGQRVRFGSEDRIGRMVIGVARNSKYSTIGERDRPALYDPYFQNGGRATVQFLVKANGTPESLLKVLNAELLNSQPTSSVELKPMRHALAFAMMPSQAAAFLLGTIGLLGLVLASVGLYGVLAYSIHRRTREIGLRVALGAQRRDVLRLVMREGAWIVSSGLSIGVFLAVFLTKPLQRFLVPDLRPTDPVTYVAVAMVLVAVGFVASLTPTLRALRIDPLAALRYE